MHSLHRVHAGPMSVLMSSRDSDDTNEAGAAGESGDAGEVDVAIAIRTGIVKDNALYVQAGAGVVADSVPELEWKETEAKARAVIRAAELVEEGF